MSETPVSENKPEAKASDARSGLFGYPGFAKLFFGSLVGKLGDRLYQTAMAATALVVFAGGKSEDQLSNIQIVATVPLFFAYFAIGTLIDTANRRRLMSGIMAIKAFVVLIFVPFLWSVQTSGNLKDVNDHWSLGLALICILSLIDAPFSPARAASVPDVSPPERRQLGASLIATSGLISTLFGSLGFLIARADYLGPAYTILVAFGCFAFSALLLRTLPAVTTVPGITRHTAPGAQPVPAQKGGIGEYFRELFEGFHYVFKTRGLWELVVFETVFWCIASAFYVTFSYFLDSRMHLRGALISGVLGGVLCTAGVGLFLGALLVGKLSRRVTPLATYPIAFLVMGCGAILTFSATPDFKKSADPNEVMRMGDWVEIAGIDSRKFARVKELEPVKPDAQNVLVAFENDETPRQVSKASVTLWLGSLDGNVQAYLCVCGFILGFGGGLLLGRVDADVLGIADEKLRGRVFSIKANGYTMALIGVMGALTYANGLKPGIVKWLGPGLLIGIVPAFLMSWFIDAAIWAEKGDNELPGPLHRFGYQFARAISVTVFKIMFRYSVVGAENLPATGPVVLAANHASFIDPLLLGCSTRRNVQYIMHASYYRSFAHPLFRFMRCIPVDEKNQLGAIKAGVRSLNQGACIGIFPEGHVADDGKLQMPMAGALFLAQRSGAPVVPAAIKGNFAAFPRHAWFPRPAKVTVILGKPLTVGKDLTRKQVAELTDEIMVWLGQALELAPPPKSADKERDRGERNRGAGREPAPEAPSATPSIE